MTELAAFIDHFRQRVLQDALTEATATYWLRRAEQFEAAKPRPGDFHGLLTPAELSAKWSELDSIARACRVRASASPVGISHEVADALSEVAA
ncbi:hypothetical protein [Nocardioides pyridinolyticus]